jgi:hypothetical protein
LTAGSAAGAAVVASADSLADGLLLSSVAGVADARRRRVGVLAPFSLAAAEAARRRVVVLVPFSSAAADDDRRRRVGVLVLSSVDDEEDADDDVPRRPPLLPVPVVSALLLLLLLLDADARRRVVTRGWASSPSALSSAFAVETRRRGWRAGFSSAAAFELAGRLRTTRGSLPRPSSLVVFALLALPLERPRPPRVPRVVRGVALFFGVVSGIR